MCVLTSTCGSGGTGHSRQPPQRGPHAAGKARARACRRVRVGRGEGALSRELGTENCRAAGRREERLRVSHERGALLLSDNKAAALRSRTAFVLLVFFLPRARAPSLGLVPSASPADDRSAPRPGDVDAPAAAQPADAEKNPEKAAHKAAKLAEKAAKKAKAMARMAAQEEAAATASKDDSKKAGKKAEQEAKRVRETAVWLVCRLSKL